MRFSPSNLLALTVLAEVGLISVTLPLWFARTDFPQIALFPFVNDVPIVIHQALAVLLVASCLLLATVQFRANDQKHLSPSAAGSRATGLPRVGVTPWLVVASALSLAILDQHRLQPWHWLMMLLVVQWCLLPKGEFHRAASWTFASIYIFAALSRFGPDVASGMSGQVLQMILQTIGLVSVKPETGTFFALAAAMNLAELCVGIGLLFRITRRLAVGGAVLLHLTLLICLSPVGLNHHVGVLVWNAFLMTAIVITCWPERFAEPHLTRRGRLAVAVVVLIPVSGLFGFADNWLSWQVYSPRPEVLQLTVDEDSISFLPESLRKFVQPPQPLQTTCPIRLDRWSLQSKWVPIYPEDRFQIAVAKKIVQQAVETGAPKNAFAAQMRSAATFPWWNRSTVEIPL